MEDVCTELVVELGLAMVLHFLGVDEGLRGNLHSLDLFQDLGDQNLHALALSEHGVSDEGCLSSDHRGLGVLDHRFEVHHLGEV